MALLPGSGWTASALLPSLAAGFSPGAAWSSLASAQSMTSPNSLKAAMESKKNFRTGLLSRILGSMQRQSPSTQPKQPQQPNQNPAVNSLSTVGFSYPPGV